MRTDYNTMAGKADQTDLCYMHSSGIGIYFDNFALMEFGSELESVVVFKKNQDDFSSLDYMCLKMDHRLIQINLEQLELTLR